MNCHRVMNMISAYVDGELTGMEMLEIRRHIDECEECAEEYESIRSVKLAVNRLADVTPRENFAVLLMSRLDEVRVAPHQRVINSMLGFVHSRLSPVAAALAASGLALVLLTAGGSENIPQTNSTNVLASAPFRTGMRDMTLPGSPVAMPSEPELRVADEKVGYGATYELAGLSHY